MIHTRPQLRALCALGGKVCVRRQRSSYCKTVRPVLSSLRLQSGVRAINTDVDTRETGGNYFVRERKIPQSVSATPSEASEKQAQVTNLAEAADRQQQVTDLDQERIPDESDSMKIVVDNETHEISKQLRFKTGREDDIIIIDHNKFLTVKRWPTEKKLPKLQILPETIEANAAVLMVKEAPWEEPIVDSIDSMKPLSTLVSAARYEQAKMSLKSAFNKEQLSMYAKLYGATMGSKSSKARIINYIVDKIWTLHVSVEVEGDLITEREYIFKERRQLVLLLSNSAAIPRRWTRLGAGVVINPKTLTLTVRAPKHVVDDIISRVSKIMSNIVEIKADFSFLAFTPEASIHNIPLGLISRLTNTDVEVLDGKTLRISALGMRSGYKHIDIARRMCIMSMNIQSRMKELIMFTPGSLTLADKTFFRVDVEDSLSWNYRLKEWVRWRQVGTRAKVEGRSEKPLTFHDFTFEYPMLIAREMQRLKAMKCDILDPVAEPRYSKIMMGWDPQMNVDTNVSNAVSNIITEIVTEPAAQKVDGRSESAAEDYSTVFHNLDVIADRDGGLSSATQMIEPEYSATFGLALHSKASVMHDTVNALSPNRSNSSDYIFLETAPQFTSFIDTFSSTDGDSLDNISMLKLRPYTNLNSERRYIVLRFLAAPYANPRNFTRYPPLEMVIPVSNHWKVVTDKTEIFASLSNAAMDLFLPTESLDIRFRRRVREAVESDQPGVRDFMQSLSIDLSDQKVVSIPPTMDINLNTIRMREGESPLEPFGLRTEATKEIGTEPNSYETTPQMSTADTPVLPGMVRYMFESFEQRTELQYDYETHRLRYTVVEGGVLNGRRHEVSLIPGDKLATESDQHNFASLAVTLAAGSTLLGRAKRV